MAATTFSLYALFMTMLASPVPPMPMSGVILSYGGIGAALYARSQNPVGQTMDDASTVARLDLVDGKVTGGVALFCRVEGHWMREGACQPTLAAGDELIVLDSTKGAIGKWKLTSVGLAGDQTMLGGEFVGEAPTFGKTGYKGTLLAVKSQAASPAVRIDVSGYSADELASIVADSRRPLRLSSRMSDDLQAVQYAVAPVFPGRPAALFVSANSHPEGPLDAAARPSISILFARITGGREDGSDWLAPVASQVISKEHDLRKFERYALAGVLDVEGDGLSELVVRGRSSLGDRYRLYRVDDHERLRPVTDWAGIDQPTSAPRQ